MSNTAHAFVIATAVWACLHDLYNRRIPNYLTFGSAVLAVAYHVITGGWAGLGLAAAGWGLGMVLFLPFFLLRGMGGGDVKLLAALGAWVGPLSLLPLTFYTAMAGGVMALIVVARRRQVARSFNNLWLMICHWRVAGLEPVRGLTLENKEAPRLAYGLPIAAGTLITIWLQ